LRRNAISGPSGIDAIPPSTNRTNFEYYSPADFEEFASNSEFDGGANGGIQVEANATGSVYCPENSDDEVAFDDDDMDIDPDTIRKPEFHKNHPNKKGEERARPAKYDSSWLPNMESELFPKNVEFRRIKRGDGKWEYHCMVMGCTHAPFTRTRISSSTSTM
jgi:hypothetical protein